MNFLRYFLFFSIFTLGGINLSAEENSAQAVENNINSVCAKETYEIAQEIKQLKENDPYIKKYCEIKNPDMRTLLDCIQRAKLVANKDEYETLKEKFVYSFDSEDYPEGVVSITETQAPKLYSMIKELAGKLHLLVPSVFISFNKKLSNAEAFTISERLTGVIIGEKIINDMSDQQLKAVLAHECAHLAHDTKHSVSRLDRFVTPLHVGLVAVGCYASVRFIFSDRFPDWETIKKHKLLSGVAGVGLVCPWALLALLAYTRYIKFGSPADETAADTVALAITKDPEAFVAAMEYLKKGDEQQFAELTRGLALVDENIAGLKELSEVLYEDIQERVDDLKELIETESKEVLVEGSDSHPSWAQRISFGKAEIEKRKQEQNAQLA